MTWIPTITRRATGFGPVVTVKAAPGQRLTHVLRLPGGACPVSGNPIAAALCVRYTSTGGALEVVSLRAHALALWASPPPGAESVEGYAATLSAQLRELVPGAEVTLAALVRPGPQLLMVRA